MLDFRYHGGYPAAEQPPWHLKSRKSKGRCIPILCLPVFNTTSPGMGDCLNSGWLGRTWEFHPARIARAALLA